MNTTETVTIQGIAYLVMKSVTPEVAEADGYGKTAEMMRANRQRRQVYMKRPAGTRMYFAVEHTYSQGRTAFGKVVTLGSWS
jgi:hypothetical protein